MEPVGKRRGHGFELRRLGTGAAVGAQERSRARGAKWHRVRHYLASVPSEQGDRGASG